MMQSQRINVFDRDLDVAAHREFARHADDLFDCEDRSVLVCNVHMLMLSQEDPELAAAMAGADRVLADGVPVAWLQRRRGRGEACVVRGYEMVEAICARAAKRDEPVGFFGSTEPVLEALISRLSKNHPGLRVTYRHSPPFVEGELYSSAEDLQAINESGVRWLFAGLGCPKQEKWIHAHSGDLRCTCLGLGAAFDWLAGTTARPPGWMENSGLGWLHRLLKNPRSLWNRYLIYNTKFVIRVLKS